MKMLKMFSRGLCAQEEHGTQALTASVLGVERMIFVIMTDGEELNVYLYADVILKVSSSYETKSVLFNSLENDS